MHYPPCVFFLAFDSTNMECLARWNCVARYRCQVLGYLKEQTAGAIPQSGRSLLIQPGIQICPESHRKVKKVKVSLLPNPKVVWWVKIVPILTMVPYMMASSVPIFLNFDQSIRRSNGQIQPISQFIGFFVGVGLGAEISALHWLYHGQYRVYHLYQFKFRFSTVIRLMFLLNKIQVLSNGSHKIKLFTKKWISTFIG